MALITETGTGIVGAESYASASIISAYWLARPHDALAAPWAAAALTSQEGAARESTAYLDAIFGPYYRGVPRGNLQGLLFPRTGARDEAGFLLPDLPTQLITAVCELSGRALSARLIADVERGGQVVREKVAAGVVSETQYAEGATIYTSYGFVNGLLAPILNGLQPDAPNGGQWTWA